MTTSNGTVLSAPAAMSSLGGISVENAAAQDVATTLALSVSVDGSVVTIDVPVRYKAKAANLGLQEVIKFGAAAAAPELVQHLEANRLHYSRAAFARLDGAAIASLLASFTFRGLPVGRIVDPKPIATTANFLVFKVNVPLDGALEDERFAAEQREFKEFLTSRGLDRPASQSQIVPLPSEGVFAEAVLGRFNSAEKIDLTRFWNWQDSPIPITAPEIAPIAAKSRAEAEALRPGQFGVPVVTIQAPTTLPAAAGVGAMLQGIQTANLFRDMSGIAQTGGLAQSAVQASGAGATSAGEIAAQNLKTKMEQQTARMKIAADMLGAINGQKPAPTQSEKGGQLAAARAIDKKPTATGTTATPEATVSINGTSSGAGADAGRPGAGGAAASATPESLTAQTLQQQVGGGMGNATGLFENPVVEAAMEALGFNRPSGLMALAGPNAALLVGRSQPRTAPDEPTPSLERVLYQLTVRFIDHRGPANVTVRTVNLPGGDVEIASGASTTGSPVIVGVPNQTPVMRLAVSAVSDKGHALRGIKDIAPRVPEPDVRPPFPLTVEVLPVLAARTFTIGSSSLLVPDFAALEVQALAAGIVPTARVGDPEFTLVPGTGFKARIVFHTGSLLIRQVR